ncbi:hypothetical protein RRF57_009406 [Xylaria bambusicola]|uniref:Uncharacterized protein n=1 Tax=Xylaria bambusicola TaxID=326684 RepID=A0AAN7Z7U1_9PEZI
MKNPQYILAAISLLLGTFPVLAEDTCLAAKCCLLGPPQSLRRDAQLRCSPPIDDGIGSQPIDWSPWRHQPNCVSAEKDPNLKYCVYSNSLYSYKGINIITKPRTAAESAVMLNEEFPGGHKPNTTTPSYPIVDIPHKGKGVVATRRIRRAEAFMSDWASVVLDLSFPKATQ